MRYIYSSKILHGKQQHLQKWSCDLSAHQKRQPESWELVGIYFSVFSLPDNHVELHWEIEDYSSFEKARHAADGKSEFNSFLEEMHSFLDPNTGTARLLKPAGSPEALIVGC